MPGAEEDDDDPTSTVGSNPDGQAAQPTGGQPTAVANAGAQGGQQEGVHQVKDSEFKQIKDKARAKGRQQALDELDAKARAVGFESHEDALKALASLKKGSAAPAPAATAATPAKPQGAPTMPAQKKNDKEAERIKAEQARSAEQAAKMRQQWRKEERERRVLQAKLDAKQAEMDLREECYRFGVKDVDYTIRLLTRQLEGKSKDEIAKFDRNAFYEGLKKDRPYLFGEVVAPATTGTTGATAKDPAAAAAGAAPAAPAAGDAGAAAAAANKFDARKAKPEEVQARLRELGLNPHL